MDHISILIEKLQIRSAQNQLPGKPKESECDLDEKEINQLLGYSSILSLSKTPNEKILAYEIITRLIELQAEGNYKLLNSAEIILSRLGNFPGRKLLRERFNFNNDSVPNFLKLECLTREVENSVFFDEEIVQLTDFQYKFFNSLQKERALSISAPTSAGKSFVLSLNIIKKLREKKYQCIIYIVPTRALITEVSNRIRDSLRQYKLNNIIIRTAPFPVPKEKAKDGVVYVLTQERLLNYLSNSIEEMPNITSLLVDEAHEIQKGKRGILLQSTIDYLLKIYPSTEILFASPLIKNPGYFFNIFNISDNGKFFIETIPPVSQNIILVSDVHGKPREIKFELLNGYNRLKLGPRSVDFDFRGKKTAQKASLANAISRNNEAVIVFSNGPSEAESVAKEICKTIVNFSVTDNVKIFIDFLKQEIHPEYALINCLESGVGFHYGKMPSIVRSGIESLYKNEEIKYICCTSTLLQGVNLPAKHIIIENPKSGVDIPMSRSDFLNLSGRAGRLLKEFHGNIWCIRPSTWDYNSYEGDTLQEISSAISSIMTDGGSIIQRLLSGSILSEKDIDEAEMAFSKLYQDYHFSEKHSSIERYRTAENSDNLDITISAISKINVNLPSDIIEKNKGIRPDHLQRVYDFLLRTENLDEYTPVRPFIKGAKARMENIIDVFINCFEWELSISYKNMISFLAYNWMWGKPLGELLSQQVSYARKMSPLKEPSVIIRDYLDVLDHEIRFKLVKYFSAFNDVLKLVFSEKYDIGKIEIEPYHIYLEFGSCNKEELSIMAIGLSRFTALYLANVIKIDSGISDIDDYYNEIMSIDVKKLRMPNLCKQEILSMQGKRIQLSAVNK